MDPILLALAEKILELVIREVSLLPQVDRLRQWLRGDQRERQALAKALEKAHAVFAPQYPELSAAFFDQVFLLSAPVRSEFARLLSPDQEPNLEVVERAWRAQFQSPPAADLHRPLDEFVKLLEMAIKAEPALKAYADRRALHRLYTISGDMAGQTELLGEIRSLLKELVGAQAFFTAIPMNSDQRVASVLPGLLDDEQRQQLAQIQIQANALLNRLQATVFEPYGISHTAGMLRVLEQLLSGAAPAGSFPFTSEQVFSLLAAAALHDIGLCFPELLEESGFAARLSAGQDRAGQKRALFILCWHELTAQVIAGSLAGKSGFPDLGLRRDVQAELVVQIIRHLPLSQSAVPETILLGGQPARLSELVALLRFASALELASEAVVLPTQRESELAGAYPLLHWLRYYTGGLQLDGGLVRPVYQVPNPKYEAHIQNAYYGFFVRQWTGMAEPLLVNGWHIHFLSPLIQISPLKEPMPERLWAILTDPAQLEFALHPAFDVLGSPEGELPDLEPYYFGAVPEVIRFDWGFNADEPVQYKVQLFDLQHNQRLWEKSDGLSLPFSYPYDVPLLEAGKRYLWSAQAMRGGHTQGRASGEFWLLDAETADRVNQAESRLQVLPEPDRLAALGFLYQAQQCYGQAVRCLRRLVELQPGNALARRALAALYERLYVLLNQRDRGEEADTFLGMADNQYRSLRDLLSHPALHSGTGQAGGEGGPG